MPGLIYLVAEPPAGDRTSVFDEAHRAFDRCAFPPPEAPAWTPPSAAHLELADLLRQLSLGYRQDGGYRTDGLVRARPLHAVRVLERVQAHVASLAIDAAAIAVPAPPPGAGNWGAALASLSDWFSGPTNLENYRTYRARMRREADEREANAHASAEYARLLFRRAMEEDE